MKMYQISPESEIDKQCLLELYNACGGDSWTKNKWNIENDWTTWNWHGVELNEEGRLINLKLRECGLTGGERCMDETIIALYDLLGAVYML